MSQNPLPNMLWIQDEDWPALVKDILNYGVTETQIARSVGTSQATVNRWASGRLKRPRWLQGERLRVMRDELGL